MEESFLDSRWRYWDRFGCLPCELPGSLGIQHPITVAKEDACDWNVRYTGNVS